MPRFVLEIGTEEMPPRFFPVVLPQLRADAGEMLRRARLAFSEAKVYGSPRRLVLVAEDLADRQAPHTREERGPSAKVAFDAEGKPTKAALGFARRAGVAPESLERRQTDQGEYVFAIIQEPELPAKDALASLLPGLITGLTFPKTMRWGEGKLRFGRPIRWLLALVGDDVVEFELDGMRSGRLSRGHPVLADGMHSIGSADEYETMLDGKCVLVAPEFRRRRIAEQLETIAQREGASLVDGGLLDDTVYLVEWPTAALGRFDQAFLRLPEAILTDEMQHVQSYFPLRGRDGKLLPRFIAIRDGNEHSLDAVVKGWESVLRAKLIDATFFYEEDLKTPLADRLEALGGVVFGERLGTMYEKVERIQAVAEVAADEAALAPEERAKLDRAALLCKADLTTEVVAELSALQGVIGREYALVSGEDRDVADAIGEHYRPRFSGDRIPETQLGRILALCDKLDALAALFAIGAAPTGSTDPFGLRREAYGVVNILLASGEDSDPAKRFHPSLSRLLGTALSVLRGHVHVEQPDDETIAAVTDFLRERLAVSLREGGIRYDLVDAALTVGIDDINRAAQRAHALSLLEPQDWFLPTVIACTRPMNIARGFEGGEVDPGLFAEAAERNLWYAYQEVAEEADRANLMELFGLIADRLRPLIDRFFDDVLVMHEDPAIRRNRLALCWKLSELFRRIADFPLIVQS